MINASPSLYGFISISEFVQREKDEGRGILSPRYLRRLAMGGTVLSKKKNYHYEPLLTERIHFTNVADKIWLHQDLRIIRKKIFFQGKEVTKKKKKSKQ